jgi:hypothetical protein
MPNMRQHHQPPRLPLARPTPRIQPRRPQGIPRRRRPHPLPSLRPTNRQIRHPHPHTNPTNPGGQVKNISNTAHQDRPDLAEAAVRELTEALAKISDMGAVCENFMECTHRSCSDSCGAKLTADEVLAKYDNDYQEMTT